MKPCKEVRELRNKYYEEFLSYVERKILNNVLDGYIFIDENEATDKKVSFRDGRWINLLEEAGYKIDYCNNYVTPTVKISGW